MSRFNRFLRCVPRLTVVVVLFACVIGVWRGTASAGRIVSRGGDPQADSAPASDLTPSHHELPGGHSQPLPEAIPQTKTPELSGNSGGSKPAFAARFSLRHLDELLSRHCCHLQASPRAICDRSIQILFCTWLI